MHASNLNAKPENSWKSSPSNYLPVTLREPGALYPARGHMLTPEQIQRLALEDAETESLENLEAANLLLEGLNHVHNTTGNES